MYDKPERSAGQGEIEENEREREDRRCNFALREKAWGGFAPPSYSGAFVTVFM